MALLHYQNLGVPRPDAVMRHAFYRLKDFYDFLRRTKTYMEGDAAVRRLAWEAGAPPDDEEAFGGSSALWVRLLEAPDRPNEPEATFRAFLDENVREVFDAPADRGSQTDPSERRSLRDKFSPSRRIEVLDRDAETNQLLLAGRPSGTQLLLRPNTLTLHRQLEALKSLQGAPLPAHIPLLRLVETVENAAWPPVTPSRMAEEDWMVLTSGARPGATEQREFVERALATPDFLLLEGPPGSGKTTAICELVLQLAKAGRRALLCASTHVAVDNVLERLMDARNGHRDLVIPVRIGEPRNVSEKARPWQLERFVKTERERLLRHLEAASVLSDAQRRLLSALRDGTSTIERMVLDAANLVCGTTIGILQHPDIKARGSAMPAFDVLIVDEASKTTFHEFLVPALLAGRWVIVGDPKQLSPYVDDDALAANVQACEPDSLVRDACIDVFLAKHPDPRKRRIAVVAADSPAVSAAYVGQAAAHDVDVADATSASPLATTSIVLGPVATLERRLSELPLDATTVRGPTLALLPLRRRAAAWLQLSDRLREELPDWEAEIGWRLARQFEQRFAPPTEASADARRSTGERLREQIQDLLPAGQDQTNRDRVWREIDRIRRVALPSVLESLRHGFERSPTDRTGSALSDGFPEDALKARHVLLRTQHRMHPDIAEYSHKHIYGGEALITPAYMLAERQWSYARHAHRSVWLDVRGGFHPRSNANPREAQAILTELHHFDAWAQRNHRTDGRPWEAAVLTFYRGQEREVRSHLRRWSGQPVGMRHFTRGSARAPHLSIDLCTVDRFQGHEADLVLISFATDHATSFLESPNRLNVALTRARHQRIVIGDRRAMLRARHSLLSTFVSEAPWEQSLEGGRP